MNVRFLIAHAYGSVSLFSLHHEPLLYHGFGVSNTNAVPSEAEEERIDRAARIYGTSVGHFHGGPSNVIDAAVLADTTQRIVITMQNPKGSGGITLSVMRYSSTLPRSIPARHLPLMTIAGIGIGSPADEVLARFGEPYAIAQIGTSAPSVARKHVLGKPSWFFKDLGDGVYYYVGPVPNKAQSCTRTFGIIMQSRKVSGIVDSVEC